MNKDDVIELLDYNRWAKERLLASLGQMKQEDFEKDLHSSHGGIRGTLFHMLAALNIWTSRLSNEAMVPLDDVRLKEIGDFENEWNKLEEKLSRLVSEFNDEQLHSIFEYQDTKGIKYSQPRMWGLQQLFNHFTYHRGQIVAMQRQLGYTPPNSDLIGFYRERQR